MELGGRDVVVVVLVKDYGDVAEGRHITDHGGVGAEIKIKNAFVGRNEEGADGNGYLRLARRHGTHEEGCGEESVDAVDVGAESRHDGEDQSPLSVVVYLVHLVHQARPLGEVDLFFLRHFTIG